MSDESVPHKSSIDDHDEELRKLLGTWEIPDLLPSNNRRLIAAYRQMMARRPLWRRLATSSVSVPVPVAVALALLLLGSASHLAYTSWPPTSLEARTPRESLAVRIVEVPVVQVEEKVKERVVYVHRSNREVRRSKRKQAPNQVASAGHYLTRGDFSGFEPVQDSQLRVIRGSERDED